MEADKDNRPHNPNHHLHRPTTASCNSSSSSSTAGELLICFSTSRLSSSSMKISSSKSILSPGRRPSSRDQHQASLSTSLSRRLRTNGSIKGGAGQASPMFPAAGGGGKKRGCGFDNPEPSSPKVTCIGQVRVKTKKQTKKLRARSLSTTRRPPPATPGREGSFRRLERGISDGNAAAESVFHQQSEFSQQRNQRWVHLPLTICEALRTFGSEFNCFLPCRSSSCLAGGESKESKEEGRTAVAVSRGNESNDGGSCGTVFARWLVAVQERDVKGREIELVAEEQAEVEEDEVYSSPEMRRRSYRRYHGFEKIDFDLKPEAFEGEESRMSSCIPPRNALLLMRCRSDPVKVAALGSKFWNPPDADEDDNRGGNHGEEDAAPPPHQEEEAAAAAEGGGFVNVAAEEAVEMDEIIVESDEQGTDSKSDEESMAEDSHLVQEESATDDEPALAQVSADGEEIPVPRLEVESVAMSTSVGEMPIDEPTYEEISDLEKPSAVDNDEEIMAVQANLTGGEGTLMAEDPDSESAQQEVVTAQEPEPAVEGVESQHLAAAVDEEEDEEPGNKGSEPDDPKTEGPSPTGQKSKERENNNKNINTPLLPDCLLLMMCEPKLSMEVSKETWVCSTDFIRWLPEPSRAVAIKKIKGGDASSDDDKKTVSVDVVVSEPVNKAEMRKSGSLKAQQHHHQAPRSSCSYPAAQPLAWRPGAESTGSGLEMKLKSRSGSKAYDYELPLMLKRCKSEPRNAAAKLAPEACCWKNRKLEPHRLGIGAAGVGF
ncbi:unnamed protein product [Linum trigynum]|uniref:Uncharacterized protein n=1 Tax=Linum trigynum TaxID=586398 RepID=A0AAV2GUE4_9ROSI